MIKKMSKRIFFLGLLVAVMSEKSDEAAFYIQFTRAGNSTEAFRGANSQYS